MERTMPLIGDRFPDVEVQSTHGKLSLPGDYQGKWFVLFSHPGDFTPVCTTEFVSFQRHYKAFHDLNAALIGMSIDQVHSHIKWVEWIHDKLGVDIEFPIIADTGKLAATLGMIHPNKGSNTVRAVFIVDPRAIVRAILYYPMEIGRNIDEIVRMVKAFRTAEEHKVAVPADWPSNELIGDAVIIPPPSDIKTARERPKQYECYDWWFCHRKLGG